MSIRNESSANNTSSLILRSPQERKQALRQVITRTESLREGINERTIQNLESCMEETDNINSETTIEEKMRNQEEVLLDSEVINISSKILRRCTRSLTKHMSAYNYEEFAKNLVQYVIQLHDLQSETPEWSLLEARVRKCFKTTPNYSTLLGTLTPLEKKEVVKRKVTVKEAQVPVKRPENVMTVDKEEEGLEQTVLMKDFITRYYKANRQPLNFFKLILHPTDFCKTIENTLHISFLMRDGKIKVTKDDSGTLVVTPCSKETIMRAAKAGKEENVQSVIYLKKSEWKALKDAYQIKKPMLDFGQAS